MDVVYEDAEIWIEEMQESQIDVFNEVAQRTVGVTATRHLIEDHTLEDDYLREVWMNTFCDSEVTDSRIKIFWKNIWQFWLEHKSLPTPYQCAALNARTVSEPAKPYAPRPLFEVESDSMVVATDTFGDDNRPVLQYSDQFGTVLKHVGKAFVLQHALTEGKVCDEGTDLVPAAAQQRVIDSIVNYARVSTKSERPRPWIPISRQNPLNGVLYLMYTRENLAHSPKHIEEDVPMYIGICRRDPHETGKLNQGLAKITNESKMARWGYGENEHLGALSQACFADPTQDAKQKYQKWSNALFKDGERTLKEPVYVEVLPWSDVDLAASEESLVHLSSYIYGSKLLNSEHAIYELKSFSLSDHEILSEMMYLKWS